MRQLLLVLPLVLLTTACGTTRQADEVPFEATKAPPRSAAIDWRETYGQQADRLVFKVERLEVHDDGWQAAVAVTNDSSVAFKISRPADRTFGLMVFGSGDHAELDRLNKDGALPSLRPARELDPPLPAVLAPGETWSGTMSAPGALPQGRWVRVVFGVFEAAGKPPEGLQPRISWITDSAYEL